MQPIATREAFGQALADLGSKYDFFVLDADLSKATKTVYFQKKFPERFYNIGIAESNMMGVAAGLAACGKTVFACSFAMFSVCRAFEQIRSSICYPNLNVKVVGTHGGLATGEDGASHQCIEDLSLMRALPNMVVLSPADGISVRAAVEAAILHKGPVYLRLGKNPQPLVYEKSGLKLEIGKGVTLRDGADVTLIATGIMVATALKASLLLGEDGISSRVIDMHTIKPIDAQLILKAAHETGAIVTVEDHTIIGGLGSAVVEVLAEQKPTPVKRIGIPDQFGRSGKPEDLMKIYGLTANDVYLAAKELTIKKSPKIGR